MDTMTDLLMHSIPPSFRKGDEENMMDDTAKVLFGQMITMCGIYLIGKMLQVAKILPKTFNRAWILTLYSRYGALSLSLSLSPQRQQQQSFDIDRWNCRLQECV